MWSSHFLLLCGYVLYSGGARNVRNTLFSGCQQTLNCGRSLFYSFTGTRPHSFDDTVSFFFKCTIAELSSWQRYKDSTTYKIQNTSWHITENVCQALHHTMTGDSCDSEPPSFFSLASSLLLHPGLNFPTFVTIISPSTCLNDPRFSLLWPPSDLSLSSKSPFLCPLLLAAPPDSFSDCLACLLSIPASAPLSSLSFLFHSSLERGWLIWLGRGREASPHLSQGSPNPSENFILSILRLSWLISQQHKAVTC